MKVTEHAGSDNLKIPLSPPFIMANSWREAKECAAKERLPQVYHDWDENTYGACDAGERQGRFKSGVFIEHRCLCMPSHLSCDELEEKERKFREENPDW